MCLDPWSNADFCLDPWSNADFCLDLWSCADFCLGLWSNADFCLDLRFSVSAGEQRALTRENLLMIRRTKQKLQQIAGKRSSWTQHWTIDRSSFNPNLMNDYIPRHPWFDSITWQSRYVAIYLDGILGFYSWGGNINEKLGFIQIHTIPQTVKAKVLKKTHVANLTKRNEFDFKPFK